MSSEGLIQCTVCGGKVLVASEYVTSSAARAPALQCARCEAVHLDEAVARSPEERESVRLAKAERWKDLSGAAEASDEVNGQRLDLAHRPVERREGGRVLVVDDEDLVREAHAAALERGGWTVVSEGDPARAKKRVRQENFDVIVTDLVMPGLSGVDLLRAAREHDLDVPVVILTGRPDLQSAVDAVQFGAFRYVAKPVAPAALLEVVRSARDLHLMAAFKRETLKLLGLPHRALGDRASLESRFERALDSLWIAYQPIVTIAGRRVIGYETVVRSEEETLRGPSDLFDAAERVGRLLDLGRKIRTLAARGAAKLRDATLLFLSAHPDTLNDFDFISPEAPLTSLANRVVLGVTERATLDRVDGLQSRLAMLRNMGYRIALDNLGTGYAGLSSFTLLQPDYVKLDASLVRAIDVSSQKRTIVKAMLQLADRDLNLIVICEGVETVAERETLLSLGADLLQGDVFAPPSRRFVHWTAIRPGSRIRRQ